MNIYETPLLTARDAASHLQMPESTLDSWLANPRGGGPLVHSVQPERRGWPRVTFAGVVEAHVLRSLRDLGFRMSEIRNVAEMVREEFKDPFALATQRIASDDASLFVELIDRSLVNQHRQAPIREVIDAHLRFIQWDDEGKPTQLRLGQYPDRAEVVIDPRFAWGRPVMAESKVPVAAVVDLWVAGESMDTVAAEFDLSRDVVEDICRVAA